MQAWHPENMYPEGPTSLDLSAIRTEIYCSQGSIVMCAGGVVAASFVTLHEVMPNLVQAVESTKVIDIAQYGFLGALAASTAGICLSTMRTFRNRLTQARFDREFKDISDRIEL